MAIIKPFYCVRPEKEYASRVAALPYDVYNRVEAKEAALKDELSFLNIDRPETGFEDSVDMYDERVYQRAKDLLIKRIKDGTYLEDEKKYYYIYELIMKGRSQTGIVACASIDDYQNNIIMKHENTREDKEQDRIRHVDTCSAQTGPIFLAYRSNEVIHNVVERVKKGEALYSFSTEDGISHNVWKIEEELSIETIEKAFGGIDRIYIADGHHRAASAAKVGLKRRKEAKEYDGSEEFNTFLSVLFPEDQLMIMPYNRVVANLNGLSKDEFLNAVRENFYVKNMEEVRVSPEKKGTFGMYLHHTWYELIAKETLLQIEDPVDALDVSLLQDYILNPILGIKDPRTDHRIDFIGGIRGLGELEKRATEDMTVAFSMYPTSIQELFAVSDVGKLMPPKSTWFEPKLRSGLFIHRI
ncbi:DUF1015 domain-containing protein [Lachnoclostridium phytofermentans]|uniref:DUF1015 domain-containing protein n=1 Tax=Lachnoclostridium phytofermentans (strain ATCC 700394 / DSM 18823 / ISDg) TaxID=357809 RepID=A9KNR0_LACP7|nr:DUF1015 domain-containing protein [Lachnoclostridium phytofermentans]ABX41661.1 conserved hypothetical protein [Lachnoclostridium phytofermentans ISDg]